MRPPLARRKASRRRPRRPSAASAAPSEPARASPHGRSLQTRGHTAPALSSASFRSSADRPSGPPSPANRPPGLTARGGPEPARSRPPLPRRRSPQSPLPTACRGSWFPADRPGASQAGGDSGQAVRPPLPAVGPQSPAPTACRDRRSRPTGPGKAARAEVRGARFRRPPAPAPPPTRLVGGAGPRLRDRAPALRPSDRRGGRPGACRSRGRCR